MENIPFIIPFGIACSVLIAIRVLATKPHTLGRICRWYWNTSFKLAAHTPFCGWMACFMIADTEEEKAIKKHYKKIGEETDGITARYLENRANSQRAEEEARQERLRLESIINHKLKRTDARIISENVVEIGGKKYRLGSVLDKMHIS